MQTSLGVGDEEGKEAKLVVFQGPLGSLADVAAREYFVTKLKIKTAGVNTLDNIFRSLAAHTADFAFVPIENSAHGTNYQVYDAIVQNCADVHIVGEFAARETLDLCAPASVSLDHITCVYAAPAILGRCGAFLDQLDQPRHQLDRIACRDDVDPSAFAHSKPGAAVICTQLAAQAHNLSALARDIANFPLAETRFLVLALRTTPPPIEMGWQLKSSFAVVIKNEPSSLFRVLSGFSFGQINITKLETRPFRNVSSTTTNTNTVTTATATNNNNNNSDRNIRNHVNATTTTNDNSNNSDRQDMQIVSSGEGTNTQAQDASSQLEFIVYLDFQLPTDGLAKRHTINALNTLRAWSQRVYFLGEYEGNSVFAEPTTMSEFPLGALY